MNNLMSGFMGMAANMNMNMGGMEIPFMQLLNQSGLGANWAGKLKITDLLLFLSFF